MRLIFLFLLCATLATANEISPNEFIKLSIPGKREKDACYKFAMCAQYQLFQKGIESRTLFYQFDYQRIHAFIIWNFKGNTYSTDNLLIHPKIIHGVSDLQLCKSFDPYAKRVLTSNQINNVFKPEWIKSCTKKSN